MTGSGTLFDPYIIYNVDDLQAIENDLTAYYELANDIDASATSGWNAGQGFYPIAAFSTFTGHFDGKGHIITGLYINRPAWNVGLFYESSGTITNVSLVSCNITGGIAGPLVYKNTGTVEKCGATGSVVAGKTGGLVQWNQGIITNCYTRCDVTGDIGWVGGFVQWNDGGTITNGYSAGGMIGGSGMSGFCDFNTGLIINCFWDTEVSGEAGSDGGTGKTTAQMKTQATFTDAGWDFTTPIWYIGATINDGYPAFVGILLPTIQTNPATGVT